MPTIYTTIFNKYKIVLPILFYAIEFDLLLSPLNLISFQCAKPRSGNQAVQAWSGPRQEIWLWSSSMYGSFSFYSQDL